MSSNITVIRVCEHCDKEFTARTTVTRFCSDKCAKSAYKKRIRGQKVNKSNKETEFVKLSRVKTAKDISKLEYLTPSDAAQLLQCSRIYMYRLMDSGQLRYAQLSVKKRLIDRKDIDAYLRTIRDIKNRPEINIEVPFDIENSVTMQEAQRLYNVPSKTLYSLIKRNNIPKCKKGKYVFVEKKELNKFLKILI